MSEKAGNITSLAGIEINLAVRETVDSVSVSRLSRDRIENLAAELTGKAFRISGAPLVELTARHPYDAARGRIDVYHPGRWDTEIDLVFMAPIVQVGPSPGEWDGTVVYANFKAPADGSYLIVGNFSGHDCTMRLNGPWGEVTAHTATTADAGAVIATWAGSGSLFFTMTCKGSIIGYLESIQVYQA